MTTILPDFPTPSANGHTKSRLSDYPEIRDAFRHLTRERKRNPTSHLQEIAQHFAEATEHPDGRWMALCPCHADSTPSLTISEGKGGRVLIHCFAGCDTKDVLERVGLSFADLKPRDKGKPQIVATYPYHDEEGELLFQVLREEPKGFKVRRPDGKGGWIWKLGDTKRVLYRLPQLLESDRKRTVYLVEGEKDVQRLEALGLVATTAPLGATKPWLDSYTESLRGRRVVVIPDNDAAGKAHAHKVASALHGVARWVRVLELPGVPDKGDVSDWLDAGGTVKQLHQLVSQTPVFDPSAQQDNKTTVDSLGNPTDTQQDDESDEVLSCCPVGLLGEVQPFPLEVFPKTLQTFIGSVAQALPCPVDFPGVMVLPVLATCIGRRRCVEVKEGWSEFPTIWAAVVARSGERKSPAFELATEPLQTLQRCLLQQYREEMAAYANLSKEEREETPRPRLQQCLTTDATIEALKDVLASNPAGIIFAADELSGWARSLCQYKGGRGDDRQHWLSIWSGSQIVCNRKSSPEPIVIPRPFVCLTGGIQPDALGDLITDGREDGFSARLLLSYPDPLPPAEWSEATVEGAHDYCKVCKALWELPRLREPHRFDPAAKAVWIEWVNQHRRHEPPDHLRPLWSKGEGYVARLAIVLFLSRLVTGETRSNEVDEASVRGATRLVDYFLDHARRVYGSHADRSDTGRIGNALKWVRRQVSQGKKITARLVHMNGLAKTPDEAKQLLSDLAELGHGELRQEARGSTVLHPTLPNTQQDNS